MDPFYRLRNKKIVNINVDEKTVAIIEEWTPFGTPDNDCLIVRKNYELINYDKDKGVIFAKLLKEIKYSPSYCYDKIMEYPDKNIIVELSYGLFWQYDLNEVRAIFSKCESDANNSQP